MALGDGCIVERGGRWSCAWGSPSNRFIRRTVWCAFKAEVEFEKIPIDDREVGGGGKMAVSQLHPPWMWVLSPGELVQGEALQYSKAD